MKAPLIFLQIDPITMSAKMLQGLAVDDQIDCQGMPIFLGFAIIS